MSPTVLGGGGSYVFAGYHISYQGSNKVCVFFADPIFVRKFLILDSKSVTHFRP